VTETWQYRIKATNSAWRDHNDEWHDITEATIHGAFRSGFDLEFRRGPDAAALPELRLRAEILRAVLNAEGVDQELASRIFNRFFFGDPRGLNAPPMTPEEVDEMRAQQRIEVLGAFEIPQPLRDTWREIKEPTND
jgi:hypothetical protein